ncbi:phospholipase D-like domain-containing protein [Myxococcus sp. Y35]|uniref:phospholipase D-like domain-containing protein n=1 Tax=Pseudomyxococcus flavus TaxID=3115648 RepID=UPI003CE7B553
MFFGRSSENPTFIPHDQISTAVQDLIKEADRELILVTPYFKPWNHLQTAIRTRLKARIPVTLIIRADEIQKTAPYLQPFADEGARVLSLDRLHAKLYMSEKQAVLTSMNLLETSALNSWECALRIKESDSPGLFEKFVEQVRAIREHSSAVSFPGGSTRASEPEAPQAASSRGKQTDLIQHFGIKKTDLKPEMIEARRTHPRAYEPWTDEEEAMVAELARRKLNSDGIAKILGRQPSAIERKMKELLG